MATHTMGRSTLVSVLLAAAVPASAVVSPATPTSAQSTIPQVVRLAQADDPQGLVPQGFAPSRPDDGRTAAEAAQQARAQHGGKVLSVDQDGDGAGAHYRVKLLRNGRVSVVRVPVN